MHNLDLRKPVRNEGESTEDYILRYGQAVIENNRLYIQAIEKMPTIENPTTAGPKAKPQTLLERQRANRATLCDFLSTRPDLVAKAKRGEYNPFEV